MVVVCGGSISPLHSPRTGQDGIGSGWYYYRMGSDQIRHQYLFSLYSVYSILFNDNTPRIFFEKATIRLSLKKSPKKSKKIATSQTKKKKKKKKAV